MMSEVPDIELQERVRSILYVDAGQSQIPDQYLAEYEKKGLEAIMQLIHQDRAATLSRLLEKKQTVNGFDFLPLDIVQLELDILLNKKERES
jgi:hypothetical protein